MKYCLRYLTKLIVLLLVLSLPVSLFACGNSEDSSSDDTSESSDPKFTVDTAKKLLTQDRLITEMFVCNSLCDKKITAAEYSFLSEDNEFASFSAIESLMDSTYSDASGEREFFLAYPLADLPTVKNIDGKTSVLYQGGSNYTDFILEETVSVSDTDDETVKLIKATTESGNEIELEAALQNNDWLLKKGIFRANPMEETDFSSSFPEMDRGSLSKLKGDILVIELFISDRETEITSTDEEEFHSLISPALERLSEQVSGFGEKLSFTYKSAYFEHENVLGTKVIDFDVMFAETGFGTLRNFAEANYDLDEYDGYFFAVCIDKDIKTSYACCDGNADTENYYGERILLSKNTAAQEIYRCVLKISGSYGYDEGRFDAYTESLYRLYFPIDSFVVEDMTIADMSPVTAYSCGMTDKLDSLYRIFISDN